MISVIICTYNRADLLAAALQTVCNQTLLHSEYEVIVVDNNSTDSTTTVINSFVARYQNVRSCVEPRQGLSHARNRGWKGAQGTYVAYVDDDCKVPERWLAVAQEVIENVSPGVFGGPYLACYNTPKPVWFKDEYGSYTPHSTATELKDTPDTLHGGNLFLRREILKQSGGFDPELGMVGNVTAYGEETALLRYIHKTIPTAIFYYDPDLWVYHLVRPEKMNLRWIMHSSFTNGRYVCRVQHLRQSERSQINTAFQLVKSCLHVISSLTVEALFWKRGEFAYFQNYLYEKTARHLFTLGERYERYQRVVQHNNRPSQIESVTR